VIEVKGESSPRNLGNSNEIKMKERNNNKKN
jgi:hypothetical protein